MTSGRRNETVSAKHCIHLDLAIKEISWKTSSNVLPTYPLYGLSQKWFEMTRVAPWASSASMAPRSASPSGSPRIRSLSPVRRSPAFGTSDPIIPALKATAWKVKGWKSPKTLMDLFAKCCLMMFDVICHGIYLSIIVVTICIISHSAVAE